MNTIQKPTPSLIDIINDPAWIKRAQKLNAKLDRLEAQWWIESLKGGKYPKNAGNTIQKQTK